jgi:hypothetical protein
MYIHEEKKIAFIAHPRTASSATGHTLLKMGFTIEGTHHAFDPNWDVDWDIFCTVRNPFDVMVSWYYNCLKPREKPFSSWLPEFLDGCYHLQGRMFFGQLTCNHILHYENLQEEFECLMDKFDIPCMEIPQRNVSKSRNGRPYIGHYTFETGKIMIDRFLEDFRANGYSM